MLSSRHTWTTALLTLLAGAPASAQLSLDVFTSGPDVAKLRSDNTTASRLYLENTSAGGHVWSIGSTGAAAAAGAGALSFFDVTENLPRLTIDATGRMGLGIASGFAGRFDARGADGGAVVSAISTSTAAGVVGFGGNSAVQGLVSPANGGAFAAGVKGLNQATNGTGIGVAGIHFGTGWGVYGTATAPGFAGKFVGNVDVTGSLSKAGGSFKIDHPLDPENKFLYHSFVESPDMMNIYNGNVVTDASGYATVTLPDYFEFLNRDFRYQLTVIDEADEGDVFTWVKVVQKVRDGSFVIRSAKGNVEVSWQVTGIRKDPWADAHRIPNSVDKPAAQKGKYLHPVEYGKAASSGIDDPQLKPAPAAVAPADAQ